MRKSIEITKNPITKVLLISTGWIFVGLGVLGIFLPVMPTTIFLIIAAACFARSSENFYFWLTNNKYLGKFIRDYRNKRAMPLRAKVTAVLMLNLTIGYSAVFAVELLWVKVLLFVIAASVSVYIISLNTLREEEKINE